MRRLALTVMLILFIFPCLVFADEFARLTSLRIQPSPTLTRFTFTLTQKTFGKIKYYSNPDRVIIDIADTKKNFSIQNAKLGGSNIKSISTKEVGTHLQFILYVDGKVTWTTQLIPTNNDQVNLQIEIISPVIPNKKSLKKTSANALKKIFEKTLQRDVATISVRRKINDNEIVGLARLEQKTPVKNKKTAIFTVVIDAGHGGKDSGARGAHGVLEKNIVLNIARKLADAINQQPNMRARLTRNGDYFVPLRQRLNLTRKNDADLFVAIHADAYFDASATGASVFALSQHGATSEAARWLAKRDNYSELDGVELDALQDHSTMVRSVLIDLAQTATIRDSLVLGNKVLDALDNISSLHYTHVEQAPFMVLKSPDIPSILVETGYISNPKEERRLADNAYQQQLADAILDGIKRYKRANWDK